jgi:hypothetical protein
MRVKWAGPRTELCLSGPELGLLLAQAACEKAGALWECSRSDTLQSVVVWLRRSQPAGTPDLNSANRPRDGT